MEFRNLITVASDDASWMERHLGLEERARTIWFRWNVRKETKPWKLEGTWGKSDSSECWNKKTKCSLILPENAERNFFFFFRIVPFWNVNRCHFYPSRNLKKIQWHLQEKLKSDWYVPISMKFAISYSHTFFFLFLFLASRSKFFLKFERFASIK